MPILEKFYKYPDKKMEKAAAMLRESTAFDKKSAEEFFKREQALLKKEMLKEY